MKRTKKILLLLLLLLFLVVVNLFAAIVVDVDVVVAMTPCMHLSLIGLEKVMTGVIWRKGILVGCGDCCLHFWNRLLLFHSKLLFDYCPKITRVMDGYVDDDLALLIGGWIFLHRYRWWDCPMTSLNHGHLLPVCCFQLLGYRRHHQYLAATMT